MPLSLVLIAVAAHYVVNQDWTRPRLCWSAPSFPRPTRSSPLPSSPPRRPLRLSRLLNIDPGVNDGLAMRFVLIFLAPAPEPRQDWARSRWHWSWAPNIAARPSVPTATMTTSTSTSPGWRYRSRRSRFLPEEPRPGQPSPERVLTRLCCRPPRRSSHCRGRHAAGPWDARAQTSRPRALDTRHAPSPLAVQAAAMILATASLPQCRDRPSRRRRSMPPPLPARRRSPCGRALVRSPRPLHQKARGRHPNGSARSRLERGEPSTGFRTASGVEESGQARGPIIQWASSG